MKWWLIFCTFFILSCSDTPGVEEKQPAPLTVSQQNIDTVTSTALLYLFNLVNSANKAELKKKQNEIIVGGTKIGLKVKVEFDGQKQNDYIYAAGFEVEIKNSQSIKLTTGIIGSGPTRKVAQNACIQQWVTTFANPYAALINQAKTLSIAQLNIYHGSMGIKGTMENNNWLTGDDKMIKKIITPLIPLINSNENNIVPIDIKLIVHNSRVIDGECRIGNLVSFEILKKLKQLKWPTSSQKILFTQFYLIEKQHK